MFKFKFKWHKDLSPNLNLGGKDISKFEFKTMNSLH